MDDKMKYIVNTCSDEKMEALQNNLKELLRYSDTSITTLAGYLCVTRQTVHNIVCGNIRLTKVMYIALRCVFECYFSYDVVRYLEFMVDKPFEY